MAISHQLRSRLPLLAPFSGGLISPANVIKPAMTLDTSAASEAWPLLPDEAFLVLRPWTLSSGNGRDRLFRELSKSLIR